MRSILTPILCGALLCGALPGGAVSGRAADRPNILLLTIDTIRADATGFGGSTRPTTPFLDSLAAGALVFDNAHSTSSWTVPAVASMMTGLYPVSHGVVHGAVTRNAVYDQEVIGASLPLVAEELKKLGYRTYAVATNAHLAPEMGYGRGFDRYKCIGFTTADSVNRTVLRWKSVIENGRGPWFVWIHYYDPHHPYREHRPWFRTFVPDVTRADGPLILSAKAQPPKAPQRRTKAADRFVVLARGLYDAEVRYTDEAIRALFAAMPALDDAVIVLAGDHGEEFLEHGNTGHCRNLNGETVRVPLFVRRPDGAGAGRRPDPVSLVDVPSTLLALAGGRWPLATPGVSLLDPPSADRALIAQLERNREYGLDEAIIGPRWKFIVNRQSKQMQLYDLAADPAEARNLVAHVPDEVAAQRRALEALLESLAPPPAVVEKRTLSKDVEAQLRGAGYIH
jgi:arylsulfatase A-like enzyme